MSKLDELIAELCPNGVEYKTIAEIATDIFRGSGITRDQITDDGIPCVRYGEIYTTYDIWFDECVSHTDETQIANKKYFEYGDILFAITGESVEEIAKSCAYVGHQKCLAGGDIVVLKHKEDPKYLSYALSTTKAQIQKSKGKVKSKVVHSSVPAIKEIKLPVPPLEVQREIVRVLDNFTFLTAELTAELTVRQKQFDYYRNILLTFHSSSNAKMKTLKDICIKISSGGTPNTSISSYYDGDIPWLRTQEVDFNEINETAMYITEEGLNNSSAKWIPKHSVIVAMYGATVGKVAFTSIPVTTNQACCNLEINSNVANYKYVFYWLSKEYEYIKSLGQGSQTNINAQIVKNLKIAIPELSEQERIVECLDKFNGICRSLTSGIPAEIAARQKQYEYYRDKLLTFKELNA